MPSACATTRRPGTTGATAPGREPSIGLATSRHAQRQVSVTALERTLDHDRFDELIYLKCLSPDKSFRQEQCEVRNGPQTDPKGVKTFVEWVPKYAGVLPKDVCKLTCRAKGTGYYVVFSQRVSVLHIKGAFSGEKYAGDDAVNAPFSGGGRDGVSPSQQLGVREGEMFADGLRRHHRLQAAV